MTNDDIKNLDLLSIFHYIVGGITAFFACFPFIHVFIGVAMVTGQFIDKNQVAGPPQFIGWLFIVMGAICILLGWSLAVCMVIAGRKLKNRKSRIFCMMIAGIECMFMPFGTILGIFTIVVLSKESVKELFDKAQVPDDANFGVAR